MGESAHVATPEPHCNARTVRVVLEKHLSSGPPHRAASGDILHRGQKCIVFQALPGQSLTLTPKGRGFLNRPETFLKGGRGLFLLSLKAPSGPVRAKLNSRHYARTERLPGGQRWPGFTSYKTSEPFCDVLQPPWGS